MSLAEAWRIADNLGLAWRDWDEDEVVVFSQRLGHSLLLSAPSARVLSFLSDRAPRAATLPELVEHLLSCCAPDTPPAEALAVLNLALPEFYRIGLAEPLADTLVAPN